MRRLIVNADDFGYTRGINRSVERGFREGILTSATIMANGPAYDDAVRVALANPGLGVGVHLALTELPPLCRPEDVPYLVPEGGRLPATPGSLLTSLLRRRIPRAELKRELERQVRKVIDSGIRPTHLDSHKHVHALPPVREAVLEVAREHGVRWVRNPFDGPLPLRAWRVVPRNHWRRLATQHLKARLIGLLRTRFLRRVGDSGARCPDHFLGVSLTGLWSPRAATEALEHLREGLTEWMTHPGEWDRDLDASPTRLREQRAVEARILVDPGLRDVLQRNAVALTRYGEESHERPVRAEAR